MEDPLKVKDFKRLMHFFQWICAKYHWISSGTCQKVKKCSIWIYCVVQWWYCCQSISQRCIKASWRNKNFEKLRIDNESSICTSWAVSKLAYFGRNGRMGRYQPNWIVAAQKKDQRRKFGFRYIYSLECHGLRKGQNKFKC